MLVLLISSNQIHSHIKPLPLPPSSNAKTDSTSLSTISSSSSSTVPSLWSYALLQPNTPIRSQVGKKTKQNRESEKVDPELPTSQTQLPTSVHLDRFHSCRSPSNACPFFWLRPCSCPFGLITKNNWYHFDSGT